MPVMQYFQQKKRGECSIGDQQTFIGGQPLLCIYLERTPRSLTALCHIAMKAGYLDEDFDIDAPRKAPIWFAGSRRPTGPRASNTTGIPEQHLAARRGFVRGEDRDGFTARGPEQQSRGVDNVLAFTTWALALAAGASRPAGMAVRPVKATGRAGVSTIAAPTSFPDTVVPDNLEHRGHIAKIRGVAEGDFEGRRSVEMLTFFDRLEEGVRGCLCLAPTRGVRTLAPDISAETSDALDLLMVSTSSYLKPPSALTSFFPPRNGPKSKVRRQRRGPRPSSQASDYTAPGSAQ